jgi:hypothetical protein
MSTGSHAVMSLLAQRLPLTLLLDLRRPEGPDSQVLFLIEEPHVRLPERHVVDQPVEQPVG